MNCLLIEMGEMACYTARCPECGRLPPGTARTAPAAATVRPAPPGRPARQHRANKKTVNFNQAGGREDASPASY